MFSPARNDYCFRSSGKNNGFALLIMLAIILVAFTTIAISHLSVNSLEQEKRIKTTQSLAQSREAIMAFALAPKNPLNSPGVLPCPDTDGDGVSNPVPPAAGPCTNQRGLVPFVTLDIPQQLDGTGAPIWYVVATQYTGTPVAPYNSNNSTPSLLRLNIIQPMAFILLASNEPINGQVRTSKTPLASAAAQFLEGTNASAAIPNNSYSDVITPTQNDQVLAVSIGDFWTSVEGRVLTDVRNSLEAYHTKCGVYPFAANYALAGNNSAGGTLEGRLPLGVASPTKWGTSCLPPFPANSAPPAPSAWIVNNWGDSLYYAFCLPATPNCIRLEDALGNNPIFVSAIVMAPGVLLTAQPARVSGNRNTFYELQNTTPLPPNIFTQVKPSGFSSTFNDLIYVVH